MPGARIPEQGNDPLGHKSVMDLLISRAYKTSGFFFR
jgi:hypothetical protein